MNTKRVDGLLYVEWFNGWEILPPGPWHDEPDYVSFEHAGFPCLLKRNASWCGYVGVPEGHPWHGVSYDQVRTKDGEWPDVHYGLTYSDSKEAGRHHPSQWTRFLAIAKELFLPDATWWLGFDCNHGGDASLYDIVAGRFDTDGCTYRTVAYARINTERLAEQAMEAT